jgi:alpha-N-arabinofuranosidase
VGAGSADGTAALPLRTIQGASERAMPGDIIRIHAGTYRERIDPPRGGTSDETRIVYGAAGDGPVEIKGSEVVGGWRAGLEGAWVVEVLNVLFGDFNPYEQVLTGHWFYPKGRLHHPGAVYFDGHWLVEAASLDELLAAGPEARLWFAEVGAEKTRITARFGGMDPAAGVVEIAVRQTVFYPSREGRNFITVRGLTLLHAATPWSPPTTEQIGLLGCHWSKGWLIEDCVVRYSACAGITLGKYHDAEDFPDQPVVERTDGEDTYHGTIRRALAHGWSLDSVGGHVVRNTIVSHCEMAGICGSLGAVGSRIEGNTIHDIHVHRLFNGFEQAGIKFHGAIDSVIAGNRIFRCNRGIWLDWMSQGTRVSGNVCYANGPHEDLFAEVNHGPFVVKGNFFLSEVSLLAQSDGGAYVGNVFLGRVNAMPDPTRLTPFFAPHSTEIDGWKNIDLGDDRFLDNLFAEANGLADYDAVTAPGPLLRNFYFNGARPSRHDREAMENVGADITVEDRGEQVLLRGLVVCPGRKVAAEELGAALVSGLPFETEDGAALVLEGRTFEIRPGHCLVLWPPGKFHG